MLPAWLQLDPETHHYYRFYTRSPLLLHTQGWYQKWYYWSSSQATCIFHAIRPSLLNLHIRTLTFWHSLVGTPMMISNRCRTLKIKKRSVCLKSKWAADFQAELQACCPCRQQSTSWLSVSLRVVQGLLSHVGSQGNVKCVCRIVALSASKFDCANPIWVIKK